MDDRDNVRLAKEMLVAKQRELVYVPKKKYIPALVDRIVRKAHLRHSHRERYFRLFATTALMGLEPFCFYFKRRRHGKQKREDPERHKASTTKTKDKTKNKNRHRR